MEAISWKQRAGLIWTGLRCPWLRVFQDTGKASNNLPAETTWENERQFKAVGAKGVLNRLTKSGKHRDLTKSNKIRREWRESAPIVWMICVVVAPSVARTTRELDRVLRCRSNAGRVVRSSRI